MNYKTKILIGGKAHDTLADILPLSGQLKILFIAKTPAIASVNAGHYFQGKHGRTFWNKLSEYGILNVPDGEFEDEYLLHNNYGITDIVKVPRNYGQEPSDEEYIFGLQRILNVIVKCKPKIIVFVYKKVLDNIVRLNSWQNLKTNYGFNQHLECHFGSNVFVFPMPGTPCTMAEINTCLKELQQMMEKK